MKAVVVDASAVAPFLIPDEAGDRIDALIDAFTREQVVVPQHWRLEIANLALKAVRHRRMTALEMENGIGFVAALPIGIDRDGERQVWRQTLAMASEHRLSCYDATYLELAKRIGATLATSDKSLMRAAEVEKVPVFGK